MDVILSKHISGYVAGQVSGNVLMFDLESERFLVEAGDEVGSLDGGEVISKLHVAQATQVSHRVVLCHINYRLIG